VSASDQFYNAAEAARRLGVSTKALRLYEERGLIRPLRSEAGWRAYGPAQMEAAAEVVTLRALGLSLADIARVLGGDATALDVALAAHQGTLEARMRDLAGAMERVRAIRTRLAEGRALQPGEVPAILAGNSDSIGLDLPWPWGGERFELGQLASLSYLVGPLGSGKTRLAEALGAAIPGGVFIGLDRVAVVDDDAHARRIEATLDWLAGDGATPSDALKAVVAWLERAGPAALVFDLVEQGLNQPTQEALAGLLRHRASSSRPLVLMTRSTAILDLEAARSDDAIIYCPANHSPPMLVPPFPGAPGYEAVATCLASPHVRKRTEGVVAMRPVA
jgi:DNA-binding transcriptional MerR regulator